MATPIDFGAMGPMVAALREGRLGADELLDETGNVPADALYSGFYMLAPTTEIAQKATLLENLWNDEFVEAYQAMAQWTRDHVPFPGAAFRQVVDQLVRENVLMTGSIRLGGASWSSATRAAKVLSRWPSATASCRPPPPSPRSRWSATRPAATRCGCPAAT